MVMHMLPINVSSYNHLEVRKHLLGKLHTDLMCNLRCNIVILLEGLVVVMRDHTPVLPKRSAHSESSLTVPV